MDTVNQSSEHSNKRFNQQQAGGHKKLAIDSLAIISQLTNSTSNNNNSNNTNNNSSLNFSRHTSSSSASSSPAHSANSVMGHLDSIEANKGYTFEEQFKQLYELSEDPKRKEFLDDLFQFMADRNQPVNRIPIMAKQVLDLYELYNLVVARGGLVEVINKKIWREITKGLNLPSSITSAAFTLRTQYMKYLYPYECAKNNFSHQDELQQAIDGNRREGRRSGHHSSHHTSYHHYNAAASAAAVSNLSAALGAAAHQAGYHNAASACSSGSSSPAPVPVAQHASAASQFGAGGLVAAAAAAAASAHQGQQQAGSHSQLAAAGQAPHQAAPFSHHHHHHHHHHQLLNAAAAAVAASSQLNLSAKHQHNNATSNHAPKLAGGGLSNVAKNSTSLNNGSSIISKLAAGHPLNLAGSNQYQGESLLSVSRRAPAKLAARVHIGCLESRAGDAASQVRRLALAKGCSGRWAAGSGRRPRAMRLRRRRRRRKAGPRSADD